MDTQALRKKILDLAIRGKLVPQDPNDEPASILLERIHAEKRQMVKEGKLKAKDIKGDTIIFKGEDNLHYEKFQDGSVKCIEDEIPFEVPEGWAWCRLSTISNIVTGKLDANAQKPDGKYPFFTCGEEVFRTNTFAFDCNAVILGGNNATGDFKMHRYCGKFDAYQRVYVITSFAENDLDYLFNHVRYHLSTLKNMCVGSQTRFLTLRMITNLLIALPPIDEQKRIVKSKTSLVLNIQKIKQSETILAKNITLIKSRILNLAIRGKLVPQDLTDEPASTLLERIRAEKEELTKQGKIKRDKNASVIFKGDDNSYYEKFQDGTQKNISDEIPFEIPCLWSWARLASICSKIVDGDHNPPKGELGVTPYLMASSKNINNDSLIDLDNVRYLSKDNFEKVHQRTNVTKGDVLFTSVGSIGRSYIYNQELNICFQRSVSVITTLLDNHFLKIALDSSVIQNIVVLGATGNAQVGFYLNQLGNLLIPIPPASEQKRISETAKLYYSQILAITSII